MISFPNAKINLGLHVVEKRTDGFHNLETIFYPIAIEDALEIAVLNEENDLPTKTDVQLRLSGAHVAGNPEQNLVIKAYRLLQQEYKLPPIEICLFKQIPSGAGLGGGSSNAAFMLRMLNDRFGLRLSADKLEQKAACLGADCAFFIQNQPVFAKGVGNVFESIELSLKDYHLIVVKPDVFVSTADAFSGILPKRPKVSLKELIKQPVRDWKELMVNDFEAGVFARFPQIQRIKEELYERGALYAAMSGSGSSVFGLFDTAPTDIQIPNGETFYRVMK